jgi:hypothetical protein
MSAVQSGWYRLAAAVFARVQTVAQAGAANWAENPPLPLDAGLATTGKLLMVVPRGDTLVRAEAARDQRRARFVVGAWSVATGALATADALHFAARTALRTAAFRQALLTATSGGFGGFREVEVEPELKDIASVGSLLLSAYEVDYFQPYETNAP